MAAPIYIPTNSIGGFLFHSLPSSLPKQVLPLIRGPLPVLPPPGAFSHCSHILALGSFSGLLGHSTGLFRVLCNMSDAVLGSGHTSWSKAVSDVVPEHPWQLEVQQGGPEDLGTEGRSGALEPDGVGLGRTLKVQWNFPGRHGGRAEASRSRGTSVYKVQSYDLVVE